MGTWTEYDLHLLVVGFVAARFPTIVALNKVDLPEAAAHIPRAQKQLGSYCVPVSARSEWWLCQRQRLGHIERKMGGTDIKCLESAPESVVKQVQELQTRVLAPYGSTGVLTALSAAIAMRKPIFVCPVLDFDSLETPTKRVPQHDHTKTEARVLSAMVMIRPASTVEEAFETLRHEEFYRGDFVRAEAIIELRSVQEGVSKAVQCLRKDERLPNSTFDSKPAGDSLNVSVLRILTNRKAR